MLGATFIVATLCWYEQQKRNKKQVRNKNATRQNYRQNKQQTLNHGPMMIDMMTSLCLYQCCACKWFGTYTL